MPKILVDNHNDSTRIRNQIWAVGAMYRGTLTGDVAKQDWNVEEPRWLVSAETARGAIREIARQHAFDLSRASWDHRGQRCLFIMQWDRYYTDQVAASAEIEETTVPDSDQVVRYHRRWS